MTPHSAGRDQIGYCPISVLVIRVTASELGTDEIGGRTGVGSLGLKSPQRKVISFVLKLKMSLASCSFVFSRDQSCRKYLEALIFLFGSWSSFKFIYLLILYLWIFFPLYVCVPCMGPGACAGQKTASGFLRLELVMSHHVGCWVLDQGLL